MKMPRWMLFAATFAIAGLIVFFAVVSRAPVPQTQGTAPSVITNSTGAEAQPIAAPPANQDAREVEASGAAARSARGSGIEGVTSAGSTTAPASNR